MTDDSAHLRDELRIFKGVANELGGIVQGVVDALGIRRDSERDVVLAELGRRLLPAEPRALAGEAEPRPGACPDCERDRADGRWNLCPLHEIDGVPTGGSAATPERIVTNHAPRAEWSGAWAELGGYVQAAVDSGTQIDPANLLAYMRELRSSALRPVREWMDELMRSAGGTPDETGHHPR